MVVISGGTDFSVDDMASAASMLMTVAIDRLGLPAPLFIVFVMIVGLLIGMFHGVFVGAFSPSLPQVMYALFVTLASAIF